MKWKHKLLGWEAQTPYYDIELGKNVSFCYEVEGLRHTVYVPFDLIQADGNWEEVPDGRWLDEQFTVREFMEAFAMVITEAASGHDSVVGKGMVDRKIKKRYKN
jgi:hypothetical protein